MFSISTEQEKAAIYHIRQCLATSGSLFDDDFLVRVTQGHLTTGKFAIKISNFDTNLTNIWTLAILCERAPSYLSQIFLSRLRQHREGLVDI